MGNKIFEGIFKVKIKSIILKCPVKKKIICSIVYKNYNIIVSREM